MYASASSLLPAGGSCSQIEIAGDGARIRSYSAQEPVFCEGGDAGFLYEVIEGVVCNSRLLADGRRHVISFCYPGDLIGLEQEDRHSFNCDAVSPAEHSGKRHPERDQGSSRTGREAAAVSGNPTRRDA